MGMSGLLNSPNALMSREGIVKIGGNFLNREMTPATWDYNTFNYFLNVTLFPFIEISLTNTAFDLWDEGRFSNVDRSISAKLRVLKERRILPAVAIGSNDLLTSNRKSYFSAKGGNKYFGTHYIALSKHFDISGSALSLHTAYNILSSKHQKIDFPLSGALSFAPRGLKELEIIAEYDCRNFNFGLSFTLFNFLYLQLFTQEFKEFSFGGHFAIPLIK